VVARSILRWARRHKVWSALGLAILVLLVWLGSMALDSAVWQSRDAAKAQVGADGPYTADETSLNSRPVPKWYADAKFGVLIHWGLYSVPGYAPDGKYPDIIKTDYDHLMTAGPYAEDYWNAMKDPSSPTAKYHKTTYGDMPYEGFKAMFEEALPAWNPDAWAERFKEAGARYVVVTAKYADGFCLWPTRIDNPHEKDWHSDRDLVGELAAAVRERGMKFGIYYSGGQDWTFQRKVVHTIADYSYMSPDGDYADYADAQVRELIDLYKPDILWNDISWPTSEKRAFGLFAYYYDKVPDGVINDRWTTSSFKSRLLGTWIGRKITDALIKLAIGHDPTFVDNIKPPAVPHFDFTTPEYTQYADVQSHKWEMTRGIGQSFGYKQNDVYDSFDQTLLPSFVDAVSKNGNLLLNVGPSGGSGTIPDEQQRVLAEFGTWLARNGEGVYGTLPWTTAEASTTDGGHAHFAARDGKLYVFATQEAGAEVITIKSVVFGPGRARILGEKSSAAVAVVGSDTVLTLPPTTIARNLVLEFSPEETADGDPQSN
jgi:alpha-L-fucosidase